MMDFVRSLIGSLFSDLFTSLGARFFNRRRDGPKANTVAYGWGMLTLIGIGIPLFAIPFLVMMVVNLPGKETSVWLLRAIFGGFALLTLWTFIDGLFWRLEWNETDVTMRNWQGKRQAKWGEIEGINDKSRLQYWRINLPGGAGFAFVKSMSGAHAFIDSAVRREIPLMADGNPVEPGQEP